MNNKGNHLSWIVVKDIKKSVRFFTEILGMHVETDTQELGWAELSAGKGPLLGIAQESTETKGFKMFPGQNAIICFSVDNLEKARQDLLMKQVCLIGDVVEVPGEVKMQLLRDEDGNLFHIVESLKK